MSSKFKWALSILSTLGSNIYLSESEMCGGSGALLALLHFSSALLTALPLHPPKVVIPFQRVFHPLTLYFSTQTAEIDSLCYEPTFLPLTLLTCQQTGLYSVILYLDKQTTCS